MKQQVDQFESVINQLDISLLAKEDFELKKSKSSWSKKEIIGHLIDSAINNLQRFTEIQYFENPYKIRQYNQDELVKANNYQNKNSRELLDLLIALNKHIIYVVKNLQEENLKYQIILPNQSVVDLQFLIEDYFDHFYHHLNQINSK